VALPFTKIALGFLAGAGGRFTSAWRGQLDTWATRLRESDSNRLFRRGCAMFAFADVMHLLAHEFAGLGAGRLAFTRVLTRTFDGLSFRHKTSFCRE
jgi:hypothetical protein